MWPKVLAQLIELLPHAARLLPLADRFLQSGSNNTEATLRAIEGLRTEIHSTPSQEGLYHQLNEQSERLATIAAETRTTRTAMEEVEGRMTRLERKLRTQTNLLAATLTLSVVLLVCIVVLLLRH
jgi:hypothetical protein